MTSGSQGRLWSVEDSLNYRGLTGVTLSPDGSRAAFVVRDSTKDKTRLPKSSIWMAETAGGEPRRFTFGPRADAVPRWSPNGRTLAFLSDRLEDGRMGLCLASLDGGEARPVEAVQGEVHDIRWSPDGSHLALLMTDPETEAEKERRETQDDVIEFERRPKYARLWALDSSGADLRPVSPPDAQIWEFEWFADGTSLAVVHSDHPYEWSWYQAGVGRVPLAGGDIQPVYHSQKQVAHPLPSADGQSVLFLTGTWSDRGVVGGDLMTAPAAGGEARCLNDGYAASFSWMDWLDDRTLIALGYESGEGAVFHVDIESGPRRLWAGDVAFADRHWARGSLSGDRQTLAVIREAADAPPEVWSVALDGAETAASIPDGAWTRLTDVHSDLEDITLPSAQLMVWETADGLSVRGILLKPVGYEEGRRYPLMTIVHGGPTSLYAHGYVSSYLWAALLTARGVAVLLPNPRGSTGRGTEFAEANLRDMGGRDLEDVLAGVDAVIEAGVADPERLGIGGWSYGGFMTSWAVTQTTRFKAAVMGAGISNWRSFHGVSNLSTWDRLFYADDPYQMGSSFDRFSAVLQVDKVRTPTLILHGEADAYVPVGQAYEFYRALREHGVDVALNVYPREGHGLQEREHVRHALEQTVAWCEKYLMG